MSLAATSETTSSPSSLRIIAAASIGNALEWFDLLVYGYFAVTISRLFFPSSDQTVSLMLAFGTFGASYLVRPLGALVLGAYADKAGRKASLTVSIFLMTIGTLLMAIVPTYASIGAIAPAAMLVARLIQGVASSAAQPHFWSNTGPSGRAFSRASNGRGKGFRRCSRRCSAWD